MSATIITLYAGKNTYYFNHENCIGDGGMGIVYSGMGIVYKGISKQRIPVAIKVLRKNLAKDPIAIIRMQREAQARFSHDNIVRVLDYVEQGGKHHIISEYVPGKTVAQMLGEQKMLPIQESILVIVQALTGLGVLHRHNLIHRDIKPSNIIVTPEGIAKVMDLGIARNIQHKTMTMQGTSPGTAYYMSPEHIKGNISIASDIYSMGITLYEMISGSVPFDAPNDFDIFSMHINNPLPPNPHIPKSLFAILEKATAKQTAMRYGSADSFKEALLNWTPNPVKIDTPITVSHIDFLKKYVNQILIVLSLILLLVLIISGHIILGVLLLILLGLIIFS